MGLRKSIAELRSFIYSRLELRILLSYLVVIALAMIILALAANVVAPAAFSRHIAQMRSGAGAATLARDLFMNFGAAVEEAVLFAAVVASLFAVVISLLVTRRIVVPINDMTQASRRIAQGRYNERVPVAGQDQMAELARSFNQMAEALENIENTRRSLIADVAHELKTPLASIQGYIEGLIDGVLPAQPATYNLIYREASRLQRLVRDLEELSRLEAGKVGLRPRSLPVQALVDLAVERLRPQFQDKSIVITTHLPSDPPHVLADEDRIVQVLLNLLGNALQYSPTGGRVSVRVVQEGPFARISVTDTGMGIAADHLPHIFERFYRVDKSRSRAGGGTGIGLTIAQHIVEAHGGRIWAESPGPGRGSTFHFTLPIVLG